MKDGMTEETGQEICHLLRLIVSHLGAAQTLKKSNRKIHIPDPQDVTEEELQDVRSRAKQKGLMLQ